MNTISSVVQLADILHSANHGENAEGAARSDLDETADKGDVGTAPGALDDSLDTDTDSLFSANNMPYLNSGFVHYPEPSIYADRCRGAANSSGSAQPQKIASSIQQYDHSFSTTIDHCRSLVPSVAGPRPAESLSNVIENYDICYPSTFQNIHKLMDNNGILSFNHPTQSSFNSLLPHCHLHLGYCAPKSNYISSACPPSPQPTSMHSGDMSWLPNINQSALHQLTDQEYAGVPIMSQSGLSGPTYVQPDLYSPTMSQSGLLELANQEYVDDQTSAPDFSGRWKACLNPAEGDEGFTPYLRQQQFDKAEVILDEDNDDVDTELIFNNFQEALNWRSRTRKVDPQSSADPTIPRSMDQRKAAVKLVFKAFKSIALATDNPGMLKAFEEQKHDNRQVEAICWSIVEGCIDRCDRGPLLNAYEPEKAKNSASIKTFAERLDAIVVSLSHQKTICKHLLDAPYLNRFVDDPVGSKQRVESNRKLNKKKGGVMDMGKKALGMRGKKGRPPAEKSSDAASDNEAEGYKSESQEFRGESSGIPSPFRTPDQPVLPAMGSSGPPSVVVNPLYSAERFRNEMSTPPNRRRRAGTTNSLTPIRNPTPQSPSDQQYSHNTGGDAGDGHGSQSPFTSILPGVMMDPALYSYNFRSPNTMGRSGGLMDHYDIASNSRLASPYNDAYAAAPTSAPYRTSPPVKQAEIGDAVKSSGGSNDSEGSDSEYLPEPSGKRRRQH